MDESEQANKNPLSPILSRLFKTDIEEMYPEIRDETQKLRNLIEKNNENMEEQSNKLLADIIQKSLDFGYPNAEEMQFKAITEITLENQIKSHTDLAYIDQGLGEELPCTYNGLGYKNLIKIEFELAEFSKQIANSIESAVRSLEESIINVNRGLYKVGNNPTEVDIDFDANKKTDFALELLFEKSDYKVPAYIQSGLCWLDEQKS
jgi:hypothetical protein